MLNYFNYPLNYYHCLIKFHGLTIFAKVGLTQRIAEEGSFFLRFFAEFLS
jgi:hypothetical protein